MNDRLFRAQTASRLFGGFYRCPNLGVIIEALPNDDKVVCCCGIQNPKSPTEPAGVHRVKFLEAVTVYDYIDQVDRQRSIRAEAVDWGKP